MFLEQEQEQVRKERQRLQATQEKVVEELAAATTLSLKDSDDAFDPASHASPEHHFDRAPSRASEHKGALAPPCSPQLYASNENSVDEDPRASFIHTPPPLSKMSHSEPLLQKQNISPMHGVPQAESIHIHPTVSLLPSSCY